MEKIEIKVIQDLRAEWRSMIEPWCSFFRNEPTCSMVSGFKDPANKDKLINMLQDRVESDPSRLCVLAWDTEKQKAAGIILTNILYDKSQQNEQAEAPPRTWADNSWDEESSTHIKNIDEFLEFMIKEADINKRFGVEKALMIDITSVCSEYTRRGLAHRMTEVLIEEAKRRKYPLVVSESTSAFTQKNKVEKFGFKPIMEFDFTKCFKSFNSMSEDMRKVHNKAVVLVKEL